MAAAARREAAKQRRWAVYEAIPKGDWEQLSGRADKVLNEQAARYGIPIGGPVISLADVARWIHDFLRDRGREIRRADRTPDPDLLMLSGDGPSPALEEYRRHRAKLAQFDVEERQRTLLPRDEVHGWLANLGLLLRRAGEGLQKQFGEEAHALLDDVLHEWQKQMESYFSDDDGRGDGIATH
jgi:hypothetical protein